MKGSDIAMKVIERENIGEEEAKLADTILPKVLELINSYIEEDQCGFFVHVETGIGIIVNTFLSMVSKGAKPRELANIGSSVVDDMWQRLEMVVTGKVGPEGK
jgi:hypothetical protein